MTKKNTKPEVTDASRIGEVVARDAEIFIERFDQVHRLEAAARDILQECVKQQKDIWDDITNRYNLSKKYIYSLRGKSKTVIITGINHTYNPSDDL
jgi:hypothetical protein